ncbi:ABC transporter substrate-binding protein (plasmid) [Deinococcus sp. KNUC1210]|uniref:ABC transporter substrate-binding protein n=1 Tax=Deinococcus sp. KNUC1210 TaxID=2917691 RepID=UPI001EF027B0|nr:ABC transporter substrate-binding protein [Deinococcus sp. KNUC1210]ULH13992.1 ABC transporter substrate-binding protein [Deinococcus sp. KNUC1210]
MKKLGWITPLLLLGTLASAQVKNPDTLVSLTIADWSSFDPAQCYDAACSEILQNTLETLYFPAPSDLETEASNPKIVNQPLLAAALPTITNGGRTFTIKLNPAARFSDGTPVTAADVKYSLMRQMLISADAGGSTLLLEPIMGSAASIRKDDTAAFGIMDKAIVAQNPTTIVFNLAKPFTPFLAVLAHPVAAIYSRAAAIKAGAWDGDKNTWQKYSNESLAASPYANVIPLGTGPFTLQRYDKGQQVILRRNDKYWRSPAKLQTVVIKRVDEPATAVQLLKTGDADQFVVGSYARNVAKQFSGLPGVKVIDNVATLVLQTLFMNFNIQDPAKLGSGKLDEKGIPANFFSDLNIRRAFAASIDYDAFLKDQLLGKGVINNTAMQTSFAGYDKALRYHFSKEAATVYFKKAWGGKVWDTGFTVPVYFNSGNANRQKAAEVLKRGIEAINPRFHIDVREAQFSQILADSAAHRESVWMLGWQADYGDPHNFAQPFLASTGNYPQNTGYHNATVDKLISQAVGISDPVQRTALYRQVVRLGFNDVAEIPIYQGVSYTAQRDWVKGRVTNPLYAGDIYYYTSK